MRRLKSLFGFRGSEKRKALPIKDSANAHAACALGQTEGDTSGDGEANPLNPSTSVADQDRDKDQNTSSSSPLQNPQESTQESTKAKVDHSADQSLNPQKETNPPLGDSTEQNPKVPLKGHGRLSHEDYKGATTIEHTHSSLKRGDFCPGLCGGRLYSLKPSHIICLTGNSLVTAIKHQLERLRCSLCGEVFQASPLDPTIKLTKYDESVKAQVAIAKFSMGLPCYRLEKWQDMVGVPLKDSTQWDLILSLLDDIQPVYDALETLAAQGELIHHDDTSIRILSLMKENKTQDDPKARRGMYMTGIVSKFIDSTLISRLICLFYPGRYHSGENMEKLMALRHPDSATLIRMCDALSSNLSVQFKEILCLCLTHGRRKFYEIYDYFPGECGYVIEALAHVYHHDERARAQNMNQEERLLYHQKESGPIMTALKVWMMGMLEGNKLEPAGSLWKAMKYMMNHWDGLTRFLHVAGCPLDNNIVERTLKIPIRSRKNSLFYKTEFSARVSGMLTSIIHTCIEANENPLTYLITLQKNRSFLPKAPQEWFPWNYRQTLEGQEAGKAGGQEGTKSLEQVTGQTSPLAA